MLIGIVEPEVAKYAAVHELDTGWLRDTVDQNLDKYVAKIATALDSAAKGADPGAVVAEVKKAVVEDLKNAIEARGLVRTGRMRDSVGAVD